MLPKGGEVSAHEAYLIMPGDNLDIKLFYNPELNENVTVRPDGMISLQLVDEIKAAGMSPQELSKVLTAKYSEELKKPAVTVIVKTFAAQRVFVGGEVNNQGLVAFQPGMTAMQAIMHAGGLKPTAYPEDTLVVRKGSDREPVVARIDLGMISEGIPGGQDVALHPEDLIIVPKSKIAKANQFVNQYIEQLLLFRGVSFGFNYRVNP
jgi:protein involved in polysaccharide export with SLBB domain